MISFKLSTARGQERVRFNKDTLFFEFMTSVAQKSSILIEKCQISSGFPPKVIYGKPGDALSSFAELSDGSVVIVREGQTSSLSISASIYKKEILYLMSKGFPLSVCEQAVAIACDNLELALEISEGIFAANGIKSVDACPESKTTIVRRIIDADNCCLFNAIGYCVEKEQHKMSPVYRKVVANEILSDPDTYTADILGKTIDEYVMWIQNPEKLGGEIEMNILSKHLELEIAAVDVQTGKLYVYGEDRNFLNRIYLLYDGIHYDAIVSAVVSGCQDTDISSDITVFSVDDQSVVGQIQVMANELRKRNQFVDMSGCDIQCLICFAGLKGQKEAQAHAKATGHQNFGQVHA